MRHTRPLGVIWLGLREIPLNPLDVLAMSRIEHFLERFESAGVTFECCHGRIGGEGGYVAGLVSWRSPVDQRACP